MYLNNFLLSGNPRKGDGMVQIFLVFIIFLLLVYLYILFIRWLFKINVQVELQTKQVKLLSKIAEKLGVEKTEVDEIIY